MALLGLFAARLRSCPAESACTVSAHGLEKAAPASRRRPLRVVCGHGMLKAKRGERCACGAMVRVVRKLIHPEESQRIERLLFEDIEIRRHFWDWLKSYRGFS